MSHSAAPPSRATSPPANQPFASSFRILAAKERARDQGLLCQIIARSTSVFAVLGRGWARFLRSPARLAIPYQNYPRIRWSSQQPGKTRPARQAEYAYADGASDRALEIKLVGTQASINGGQNALDVLERPDDVDGTIMYHKGTQCLQAYRDRINPPLTVAEAQQIIVADNAGARVWRWTMKPEVRNLIEGNHPDNRHLLRLIAAIMIGAGQLKALEDWVRQRP
ncbi:Uu.00g101120.m01.CDS01 [Anthostomella pinea]|uniref:Uu.00g101120.m01.CDS01 n=1 Tax=Anthostomella pinea TaxID=933095 RepID=A0AAI8VDM7_9PEZI|nr:Uu.00g101120.m01.CDS01 [Anthostomella pinea]